MTTLISVTDTSPQDWKYISEGGATIVFSYTGDNPLFNGTVLRLRKTADPQSATQAFDADVTTGCSGLPPVYPQDDFDDPMLEFQNTVMERLIPPKYLPRLTPVRVERAWLEALANLHDLIRPYDRRQKDHIDVVRTQAVLATDLVGNDALVLEIKPKWAFLPSPTHLSPETLPIKTKTCRFCMHTHYRSRKNASLPLSYCPLDLFSGDAIRIDKAVQDLWGGWVDSKGSVNNLRIFVHGKMIQPTNSPSADLAAMREKLVSIVPLLVHTPVLRTLAKLQRSLDALDIEGLSKLWALYHSQSPSELPSIRVPPLGLTSAKPSISDWTNFVDKYLSFHKTLDHAHPKVSDLRYYLLAYLLSAIFKDCSIMLRINTGDNTADSVTVIDLDPKSIDRLGRWEALDKEIVESCTGFEMKRCVDGWKDD